MELDALVGGAISGFLVSLIVLMLGWYVGNQIERAEDRLDGLYSILYCGIQRGNLTMADEYYIFSNRTFANSSHDQKLRDKIDEAIVTGIHYASRDDKPERNRSLEELLIRFYSKGDLKNFTKDEKEYLIWCIKEDYEEQHKRYYKPDYVIGKSVLPILLLIVVPIVIVIALTFPRWEHKLTN